MVCLVAASQAYAQPPATTTATSSAPADASLHVTILHINDPHGRLEPYTQANHSVGGYARLSSLVQQVRAESRGQPVFLIHCGDEFSRGDELTRQTHGQANISVMNQLGFDLWVPGNGDFYDGMDNLNKAIHRANFPTLAANVLTKSTGKPIAREYVILKAGPVRVAVFGLCYVSEGKWAEPLTLADPIETAKRLVPQLRKQADVVVAVTHRGLLEDTRLARAVEGIDLIVGGHSHSTLDKGTLVKNPAGQNVLIAQAGAYLDHCGRIDLTLTPIASGGYQLADAKAKLIALEDDVPMDPKITAIIARLAQAASRPSREGHAVTMESNQD
jgi:5'-nucleotidase / UDP-sugar diphosphatase